MSDNTDNSEITGPTTSSKEPLRYDGNKAKLPGLLAEIWDCCERTGKFRPLIENGAVLERAAATRASAPSSSSTPHRGATAVRGGASEGDSGTVHLDKYEHAVREQPAREVRDV